MLAANSWNQSATNDTCNAIIQIAETNGNYISPSLVLQQPWKKSIYENTQSLGFKRPINLLVPGKTWLMKNLLAWLKHTDGVCAHVIFGNSAQEKIELALELCEAAENLGWYAGIVTSPEASSKKSKLHNLQKWDWSRPMLVVADYADQRAKYIHNQFEEMAKKSKAKVPKLLLLENCKSHSSDWMLCVF